MKLFGWKRDIPAPFASDAEIAKDFARVEGDLAEAQLMIAGLDATAKKYKDLYSKSVGENAHLRAENAAQQREIDAMKPLAEKARRMLGGLIPGGPKALAKQQARAA